MFSARETNGIRREFVSSWRVLAAPLAKAYHFPLCLPHTKERKKRILVWTCSGAYVYCL